MTLEFIFALLVVYQLKHFLADYPLQGQYMLRKFSPDWRVWVPALSAHAGVHAMFTFIIFQWVQGFYSSSVDTKFSLACAAIDFIVHFCMDRFKTSPNYLGKFKSLSAKEYMWMKKLYDDPSEHENVHRQMKRAFKGNTYFWWSLGFDQMVHHLTHYYLVYVLIAHLVNHGK